MLPRPKQKSNANRTDVTIFIQINPKTTNNVQIPSSSLILDDSNHPNILKPHKNPHPTKSRVWDQFVQRKDERKHKYFITKTKNILVISNFKKNSWCTCFFF